MKTLVMYDSLYGNTSKVANAIGKALNSAVLSVDKVSIDSLRELDLFVVGSPVQGGKATDATNDFLDKIPPEWLKGVKVATFDTRFDSRKHGFGIQLLMSVIRYAAEKIAGKLKEKGATVIVKPEGFIVNDKEGPLKKGELERAKVWAKELVKN